MVRRYLHRNEQKSALRRGHSIEAFIGGEPIKSPPVIEWLRLWADLTDIRGELWISGDLGSKGFLDIYSFGTPDGDDEPSVLYIFENLDTCMKNWIDSFQESQVNS